MLVRDTVELLASGAELLPKYKDHALKGQYLGFRECHVKPDLLLVYRKNNDILDVPTSGAFADKPTNLTTMSKGFEYYDETNNRPIYWNGTAWVDATGTNV